MKRSRFTEAQVIGILKEGEAGTKTAELARKHGVTEHTIYRWKAKYGGQRQPRARKDERDASTRSRERLHLTRSNPEERRLPGPWHLMTPRRGAVMRS